MVSRIANQDAAMRVDMLSYLTRATLDIIGLAGKKVSKCVQEQLLSFTL